MAENNSSLIIGISGKKQAGKTTLCENIVRSLPEGVVCIYNFADVLKDLCVDVFGLNKNQLWGSDYEKNSLTQYRWEKIPDFIKQKFNKDSGNISARHLMQIIGTDIMRNMFDNNIWVNALFRKIEKEKPFIAVIADVRFPSEVNFIEKINGLMIRLDRKVFEDNHPSETSLDDYNWGDNSIRIPDCSIEETYKIATNWMKYVFENSNSINSELKKKLLSLEWKS